MFILGTVTALLKLQSYERCAVIDTVRCNRGQVGAKMNSAFQIAVVIFWLMGPSVVEVRQAVTGTVLKCYSCCLHK